MLFIIKVSFLLLWALCCSATNNSTFTSVEHFLHEYLHLPNGLVGAPQQPHLRGDVQPASATGWVYSYAYKSTQCSGTADFVAGIKLDTCLAPSNLTPQLSYRITCNTASGYFTKFTYNSGNCASNTFLAQELAPLTCFTTSSGYIVKPQCTTSSTVALGNTYILTKFYNQPSCTTLVEWEGTRNGACVAQSSNSVKFYYPYKLTYGGVTDCSGHPMKTTDLASPGVCAVADVPAINPIGINFPYSVVNLGTSI